MFSRMFLDAAGSLYRWLLTDDGFLAIEDGGENDENIIEASSDGKDTDDAQPPDTDGGDDGDGSNDDDTKDKTAKELAAAIEERDKFKKERDNFEQRFNDTRTSLNASNETLARMQRQPQSHGNVAPKPQPKELWKKLNDLQIEYNAALEETGQPTAESRRVAREYREAKAEFENALDAGGEQRQAEPAVDIRREMEIFNYSNEPANRDWPVDKLDREFGEHPLKLLEWKHQAEIRKAGGRAAYDEALMKAGELRLAKDIREGKRQIKGINTVAQNRGDGRKTGTPSKLASDDQSWSRKSDAEMREIYAREQRRSKH